MEYLAASAKFGRIFGLIMFLGLCFTKDCCPNKLTHNFGEIARMSCKLFGNIVWLKNGKEIKKTPKTVVTKELYIFCLEPSDSGEYVCKNRTTAGKEFYNLTVQNPENKAYFQIYNVFHQKCVSRIGLELHVAACNVNQCKQKWSWTSSHQIVSALDYSNPECISVNLVSDWQKVFVDSCNSSKPFQKWECTHGDLLGIKGEKFYFNYGKRDSDIVLYSGDGDFSRWVKYSNIEKLCGRKVNLSSTHLVLSRGTFGKVICTGVNFINPSYQWLKNGKRVQTSSHSVHIDSNVLLLPFAYDTAAGNYTCVVSDAFATLKAIVSVEVFEDPSVIQYSLNEVVNIGKDVCLWCQMYTTHSRLIKWFKDDTPIPEGNPRININTTSGKYNKLWTRLCMKSVVSSDNGTYACGYRLKKSNGSYFMKQGILRVQIKPKVSIEKVEGGWLVCNASGNPLPQLVWYEDGKRIKESKNGERSLRVKENTGNYTCFAINSAGTDASSFYSSFITAYNNDEESFLGMIVGIIIGVLVLLVLVFLVFCYCRRKKKTFNNNTAVYDTVRYTASPGEYTTPQRPSRIEFQPRCSTDPGTKQFSLKARMYHSMKPRKNAEWEIPYDCIKFDKKLGEGQFGQVWKGHVLSNKTSRTVAIKMLQDNSLNDRKSFIDELEFMKTMAPHPNIVALVGSCTRTEDLMIVVEYVSKGNLKEFLLQSRGHEKETYSNLAPYSTSLTSKDLISFGYQIARGMSYLEKIKCVHRDLAARNILVADDNSCKIADFGLARDIYRENYYRKTNGGRLPLRWMAYESIFNGITTNQSDSWSFGVLLWEIVTLGGNPYPDMNRDQLIDALQRGYRMSKPHHCSDEIYAVMWECWQQNPDKRPTFAELTASFLRLISLQQIFVDMENFSEKDYFNVGSYELDEENLKNHGSMVK